MESSSVNGMCRCCASEGAFKDIKTSYHWMGDEEVYADMLRECFDVNLSSGDQGGICEVCITQLRNAANFKKQVLHTEEQFKQHLRSKGFKAAQVKEEMSGFDDNDSDDMDNCDDEDYVPEYEIPIKTESESEEKPKKRSAKAVSTRSKKSKSSDDAAAKSFEKLITKIKHKEDQTGWGITIKKIKTEDGIRKEKEIKKEKQLKKPKSVNREIKIKKVTKEPETETVKDLLKNHKMWCLRPLEPVVDHAVELQKHRHNVLTILRNSNATPFRAYHVDDGFACCFCHKLYQKAGDLKHHNIAYHASDIDTFKEKCTSIFTYVVKLDVTGLRCNLCNTEFKTLEELLPHFPTHDVILHTDIKNQITCFKFDSDDLRCLYCNQEYSNFKFLLEHMNEHYKNYLCADCGAGFINFRMLIAHVNGHDLTVGEVKCPLCYEIFDTLSKLKHHESLAHAGFDLDTNKCIHCGQNFESDECLRNHVTEEHDGRHVYKCRACNKIYPMKKMLVAHARRAHSLEDKDFKCDECGKGFYERQTLMHHMSKHTETRSYQCDLCAKMFKWKRTLRRHLETHRLKGTHKCFECEEAFFRKSFLDDHMKQVHMREERVKCPICGKMFYETQLKNHTARRHSEFRTYQCEICFTEYKTKYLLIQHMGTHDGFKPHKKEYECLACGKKFDRQIYVLKHTQRVHLLEKRFVCDQCGRRFADTTTLKNHVAIHSETNTFLCFGCPRTFKTKKTMMNHARNHMEERKVKCEICNHGFIYPYLLKEHMKQVHKLLGV